MTPELVAILAVGAAMLGVLLGALVPILVSINGKLLSLTERVAHVAAGMRSLDSRTARIETATLAHGERVARIEGALTGPWRPPNGSPAPSPEATP